MLRVSWLPLSLESPINEDEEDSELGQFVEDQVTPTPIQSTYTSLLREKIQDVLDTLPPREARIFACVLAWKTEKPILSKRSGRNLVSPASVSARSKAKHCGVYATLAGPASSKIIYNEFTFGQT